MARAKVQFICQECGAAHARWAGRCDACGGWNTVAEEAVVETAPIGGKGGKTTTKGRAIEFVSLDGQSAPAPRKKTGILEFDRVAGGGLVPGSTVLIGGDPGIGKSTLLLQAVAGLAKNSRCVYISGEEAIDQVRLRATRLGVEKASVSLASATHVGDIMATLDVDDPPDVVVIDSIQTMYVTAFDSAPGSVGQVRASAQELIRLAKRRNIAILFVGHVTKDGTIAGPRVLEHMVDTVMYFEGERGHHFRILRAVKNRFGPTDEIGVFEMTGTGLMEVKNPSALFLADRQGDVSGAVVFAGVEGSRPVLVEMQALVAPSPMGTPRRAVVGWDSGRLSMILAVLEARAGVSFSGKEVYLNVAGGMRVSEPAADLAAAAALMSAETGQALPRDMVVFGEIGLSGEVRAVSQMDARLKEASKLGFNRALTPRNRSKSKSGDVALNELSEIVELLQIFDDDGKGAAAIATTPPQNARAAGS
jgi:DNA repair protein RadA/Sms